VHGDSVTVLKTICFWIIVAEYALKTMRDAAAQLRSLSLKKSMVSSWKTIDIAKLLKLWASE
jgi:hypothetical protein